MKWIVKADSLVDDNIIEWEIDAPSGAEAEWIGMDLASKSSVADSSSVWIVPADDQPDEDKCFLVSACSQRFGMQNNYCDTLEEAKEIAAYMGNYYEFVEISYGWPGHWVTVEEA